MRTGLLVLWLVAGCGVQAVCNAKHGQDCCTDDSFCERTYGQEFPFCVNPGNDGTCSECARDTHCQDDQVCDIERSFGVCLDDETT
jgi:hypothetical protein